MMARALVGLRCAFALAGAASIACAPDAARHDPGRHALLAAVAAAHPARMFAPRLSIDVRWRSCAVRASPGAAIPQADCDGARPDAFPPTLADALGAERAVTSPGTADPDALHAAALVDALWGSANDATLSRSITLLQATTRLDDRPAAALVDLGALLLVRAGRTQSTHDVVLALDATAHALALDPRNDAALFNLALACRALGLDACTDDAEHRLRATAWSGWRDESARRPERARAVAHRPPSPDAPTDSLLAFAEDDRAGAWTLAWRDLLGGWGIAVLAGDTTRARQRLAAAEAIGGALARQPGDATTQVAVHEVRARERDVQSLRVLAAAHRDFARGLATFAAGHQVASIPDFERAAATAPVRGALHRWARVHVAAALIYAGRYDDAQRAAQEALQDADEFRQTTAIARARGLLGTIALRGGRFEDALRAYESSATAYERAGDPEHVGMMREYAADARLALGDLEAGYTEMRGALATLGARPPSPWLHNLLYSFSRTVSDEGLPYAASLLANEDVAAAGRLQGALFAVEARIARSRLRAVLGDTVEAATDREAARRALPTLDAEPRAWFTAQLQQVEAEACARTQPRRAAAALDSVIAFFGGRNVLRVLPALVTRAEARLVSNDTAGADADIARAIAVLDAQRESVRRAEFRASLLAGARRVIDRAVMLRIAAGRPGAALAYLERARTSLSVRALTASAPGIESAASEATRRDVAMVEFALVGDTLLTWVVRGHDVALTRLTLPGGTLARSAERARSALELSADSAAIPELVRLYDMLIRPVDERLRTAKTLVIVTDGEIAGVPFPALRDTVSGTYLVERHPLRFATSLRDAAVATPPGAPRGVPRATPLGPALLVANPAFDVRAHPGLDRLAGAEREVQEIAGMYPRARTIAGGAATRRAMLAALPDAAVVHFAGHAVYDEARPERSYLVLAPDADGGQLAASDLQRLPLRGVHLVVLSACETLRARAGRAGGVSGITAALLGAGVSGVVGAEWRIDDARTRALMTELHRAYRDLGDGAEALRRAQLGMLRARDPANRSPSAWAAFRYAGV